MRHFYRAAFITITASLLLLAGPVKVEAAGKPLSCSISPDGGTATVGVPVRFYGMTTGGKGPKTYDWDFSDGSGAPETSTDANVDVTFSHAGGPFAVLLDVADRNGNTACCSTTVTVTEGGGGNTVPVANDDNYTMTVNTILTVNAPGVLDNDTDYEMKKYSKGK